jgi:DNA-binding response OmpR family regulator
MEAARSDEVLHSGALEVRPGDGLVLAAGRALVLSVREFQLLVAMVRRQGGIVSREDLYSTVWGRDLRGGDRSIDVYVHKLRVKLETALPDTSFIHTHVGFGYRFAPEPVIASSHPFHTEGTPR